MPFICRGSVLLHKNSWVLPLLLWIGRTAHWFLSGLTFWGILCRQCQVASGWRRKPDPRPGEDMTRDQDEFFGTKLWKLTQNVMETTYTKADGAQFSQRGCEYMKYIIYSNSLRYLEYNINVSTILRYLEYLKIS